MKYPAPLQSGRLLRRYKRFFADVELDSGEVVTAHCPNTGALTGLTSPGLRVWLSYQNNPKRKLQWTWEQVETPGGFRVGVHTHRANQLIEEALNDGPLARKFPGTLHREVKLGESRIDFLIEGEQKWLIEVKSVTLGPLYPPQGLGYFPDAKSVRATKHLQSLIQHQQKGHQSVLIFCVQHSGIRMVAPAAHIDPDYAHWLTKAHAQGLQLIALGCELNEAHICASRQLPVTLVADPDHNAFVSR